jgi:hypothetical protein
LIFDIHLFSLILTSGSDTLFSLVFSILDSIVSCEDLSSSCVTVVFHTHQDNKIDVIHKTEIVFFIIYKLINKTFISG